METPTPAGARRTTIAWLECHARSRYGPALLALTALLVLGAYQVRLAHTVHVGTLVDDKPYVAGMHQPDTGPAGRYRWTTDRAQINLPGLGRGPVVKRFVEASIVGDALYLKADESTRMAFEEAGGIRFEYTARGKTNSMGYWTVPPDAGPDCGSICGSMNAPTCPRPVTGAPTAISEGPWPPVGEVTAKSTYVTHT